MSVDEMTFSFSAMQYVLTIAIGIYSWFISRQAASARELLDLRARVIKLEEAAKHTPSLSSISELHGDLKATQAELRALTHNLNRMNDYLMRNKKE